MITVKLERDDITPDLRRLLRQAASNGPLARVIGRAGANALKKHFRARNRTPNRLGGARTNFWSRVAESVQAPVYRTGAIVIAVSHPAVAQKVHGGDITPKKAKNLAIPIAAAAHGKSPRVFTDLRFAMTRAGVKLLGRKSSGGAMQWLYVLKSRVSQAADPDALPAPAVVESAVTSAARIFLRNRR